MRARLLALVSVGLLAACSSQSSEQAGEQTANATGGDSKDEASFVYVFGPASEDPICTGALIAEQAIVVARPCVGENLEAWLGKRGDSTFGWNKAKVTAVHIPATGPSDIAVLEIDKKLADVSNMITRYALRDGYSVFARQSVKEGLFGTSEGTTTEIKAALTTASETQATLVPANGAKLCRHDLGAMVCSSTEKGNVLDVGPRERCGLSAIVVGPGDGVQLDENGCSAEGWKVAPLGIYREFLTQFAPKLFQPIVDTHLIGKDTTFVPDGLWGFDAAGDVASCAVETTKLDPAKKAELRTVRGKASFKGMAKHADAIGQIGLARKSEPNAIWWKPATRGSLVATEAFEDSFTQDIGAAADGEYIVSLRVSANGGETWTRCDDVKAPLALVVGGEPGSPVIVPDPKDPSDPPAPEKSDDGDKTTPVVAPEPPPAPPAKAKVVTPPKDDYADTSKPSAPTGQDAIAPAKSNEDSGGCSTVPGGTGGLPTVGLLLGLAAIVRRARRR